MRLTVSGDGQLYGRGLAAGERQSSSLKSRMPPIVAPGTPALPVTAQVVL